MLCLPLSQFPLMTELKKKQLSGFILATDQAIVLVALLCKWLYSDK